MSEQKAWDTIAAAIRYGRETERERCAKIAENMRPTGGRMWTDEQHASYDALTACADNIRDPTTQATNTASGTYQTEIYDEVQRRIDAVVDAAVEWHQSGDEWVVPADKLSDAIDSLLELREKPDTNTAKPVQTETIPKSGQASINESGSERQDVCPKCGRDHFSIMRRALVGIFDYCGNDIQAIKNTAYRALPDTDCSATTPADVLGQKASVICPESSPTIEELLEERRRAGATTMVGDINVTAPSTTPATVEAPERIWFTAPNYACTRSGCTSKHDAEYVRVSLATAIAEEDLPCPFCGRAPTLKQVPFGETVRDMESYWWVGCEIDANITGCGIGHSNVEKSVAVNKWNTRAYRTPLPQPDALQDEACRELYAALENLYGDLYLVGLAEVALEDVYAGSARDAIRVLKRLQQYRDEGKQTKAIGQREYAGKAEQKNQDLG